MRKADRLFQIIELLRGATRPLTAEQIALALETTRWTVYRDIAALIGQRVPITGEAGVGYVLDKRFHMPPLMLTLDELEAISLGTQWVAAHADDHLARAARAAHDKIRAVVPAALRACLDDPVVATPPPRRRATDATIDLAALRLWVRQGVKLQLRYRDGSGAITERVVWPILVGYAGTDRILAAWCELRSDFRVFRTDRMLDASSLGVRHEQPRTRLRREWLAAVTARTRETLDPHPFTPSAA